MPSTAKDLISENDENWSMIIQPQRSLLDLRLGELWKYRIPNQTLNNCQK
jgi:hypothetical protein